MAVDLNSYDHIIIATSGGKDSTASVLDVLKQGADRNKIELWHHEVDGREGDSFFDWPVTPDYCRALGKALDIPVYFSWKVGGFKREMLREKALTAPTKFETPNEGVKQVGGERGKNTTRLKFPQVSPDLKVRWCSAYLKIDVCSKAITNQDRFSHARTLVISGERAEESPARAKYKVLEPDRADRRNGKKRRHVDRYRPVHKWTEAEVWDISKRWSINPHPAYHLGWGRLSCMTCIFGSDNQWASIDRIAPERIDEISGFEKQFGVTIHRTKTVRERIEAGTPYKSIRAEIVKQALSTEYKDSIIIDNWGLPAGAFGESCGPT